MQLIWVLGALAAAPQGAAAGGAVLKPDAGTVAVAAEPVLHEDLSPLIEMLSTSDGGFPFAKYKWQVPDIEAQVDVPAVQVVNGLPVRFSAAVSRHDVPFLMDFYAKEFVRAGLYIPPPDDAKALNLGTEFFQLTALDTDNLISYTVMFQPTDRNQTTVIMSQGYLQEWLKKKRNRNDDFAPLFPQATLVTRSRSEDAEHITYAADATAEEVQKFYREVMPKAGFQLGDGPGKYVKDSQQVTVRATRLPKPSPGQRTAVFMERRKTTAP